MDHPQTENAASARAASVAAIAASSRRCDGDPLVDRGTRTVNDQDPGERRENEIAHQSARAGDLEYTRPKQPQSTSFPRLNALAIPALNPRNRARAATAPTAHGRRQQCRASSAKGSTATRGASAPDPKSFTAARAGQVEGFHPRHRQDPCQQELDAYYERVHAARNDNRGLVLSLGVVGQRQPKNRRNGLTFEAFGVRVRLIVNVGEELERVRAVLPPGSRPCSPVGLQATFALDRNPGPRFVLSRDGETVATEPTLDFALSRLEHELRPLIALKAPDHIFVHAGVVGHRGNALLIPGETHAGRRAWSLRCFTREPTPTTRTNTPRSTPQASSIPSPSPCRSATSASCRSTITSSLWAG